jgi:hypothetical protein
LEIHHYNSWTPAGAVSTASVLSTPALRPSQCTHWWMGRGGRPVASLLGARYCLYHAKRTIITLFLSMGGMQRLGLFASPFQRCDGLQKQQTL